MVAIINTAGITAGAVVLVLILVNLFQPAFAVDALLTKNLIYFFGHVFINATIYQAVIAVYEILPTYTKRPWPSSRVFLAAWTASTIMVMSVYPHHLLMDFVMPTWALILGQVISYMSGIPILLVTAYNALTNVYRSGMRWDIVSGLLFLSIFGWGVGIIPAIIDATIAVNNVMHNTMWVPGHVHTYLIVGLVAMLFGFMYHVAGQNGATKAIDKVAFWVYAAAGMAFSFMFLMSGYASVSAALRRAPARMGGIQRDLVGLRGARAARGGRVRRAIPDQPEDRQDDMNRWLSAAATVAVLLGGCLALWAATDGGAAWTAEAARRLDVAERPRGPAGRGAARCRRRIHRLGGPGSTHSGCRLHLHQVSDGLRGVGCDVSRPPGRTRIARLA